jgi:hypothetical protein
MKLQIKDAGAWRNVATFTSDEEPGVLAAAANLLEVLKCPRTVMRVAEGDTPILWCRAPEFTWRPA